MKHLLSILFLLGFMRLDTYALNSNKADIEKRVNDNEICNSVPAFIELAAYHSAITGNEHMADSLCQVAINRSETENDKTLMLKSYIGYSENCLPASYEEAELYLKKGLTIAQNKLWEDYQFLSTIALAQLKAKQGKINEATKIALSSRGYINNDNAKEYQFCLTLGNIYYETTDIQSALDNYNRALEYAYKINKNPLIVEANEMLFRFCVKNHFNTKAEECIESVKEIFKEDKAFSEYDKYYFKTLEIDFLANTNPKILLTKGLALLKALKQKEYNVLESSVYSSLRGSFMNNNDIKSLCTLYCDKEHESQLLHINRDRPDLYYRIQALIYENNAEIDSAELYWKHSESLITHINHPAYCCNFYIRKGQFYERQQKSILALESYKKAYSYALKSNYLPMAITTTSLLDSLYYKSGDVQNAYLALKNNKRFIDSNSNLLQQEKIFLIQQNATKKLEEIKLSNQTKSEERIFRLQLYVIGFFVLFLIYLLFFLSKRSVSIDYFKMFGYITFIFFFEFIIFLLHNKFHQLTHSPFLLMLMNVTIIAILLPIHHATEHRVVHYLIKKNRLKKIEFSLKSILLDLIERYRNWLKVEGD